MIGIYNYTVVLTYISYFAGFFGIYFAIHDHPTAAILCLMFCGVCDMFDGKIARTKKNKTEEEKKFGIQIDSLCDLVCFGILPVFIGYAIGMQELYYVPILLFFPLAALIRLAYFNVKEFDRVKTEDKDLIFCIGLPVTPVAILLPVIYLARTFLDHFFVFVFAAVLLVISILFLVPFKLKKFTTKKLLILIGIGLICTIVMWVFR
ncbi:MAG: CDP-alcohol phosphatidyltransferase family protein [Lachnospiraceae bacterium]|nr:CDP-alcohol phosphatidyltransferase family protein [Lachnospiraceae bacterium]